MDYELRRAARMAMRGVPERLGLKFAQGNMEMRAKPDGTPAGSAFEFNGYATVYGAWFDMWDQNGEPYVESVAPGACKRSLANPHLDVPFLIGHNDAGIPLARTTSGTMRLSEDSHGLHVHVPAMDGGREEVRALNSAVKRGDMDEMSLAFVCQTPVEQQWDETYERRTIRDMDLHRGDVCAVTHGANPATAGASMRAVEQLSYRRPAAIGGPALVGRERRAAGTLTAVGGSMTAQGSPLGPFELLAKYNADDRDAMANSGQAMNDGSYPIKDAEDLGNAIHAVGLGGADHDAIRKHIIARAKALGLSAKIPDNWNADGSLKGASQNAASGPYELRASAADDMALTGASDYNAPDAAHDPQTCAGCQAPNDLDARYCDQCGAALPSAGQSATIMVDDATGIPSEESSQFSPSRRLELRLRELEMDALAVSR